MAAIQILVANNANSTLAGSISNTSVSITLAAGGGALFPNPTGGNYFLLTLNDAATGLLYEIVKVTARSGDTLTVVRGQEGTTALNWSAGDLAVNMFTAGTFNALVQATQLQVSAFNYGVDSGTANTYNVTLNPAPAALIDGMFVLFKAATANNGASTLTVNGLSAPLVGSAFAPLQGGEIVATGDCVAQYNSSIGGGSFALIASAGGIYTAGSQPVPLTGSNVTLNATQFGSPIIVLSGTLTANVAVNFPAIKTQWLVINNCVTGAFTVTCKTSGGTGVLVSGSGGTQEIYGDGANILAQAGNSALPLQVGTAVSASQSAQFGQISGVVGTVRNLAMDVAAASQTATITADEIIVESALGGLRYCLASFNRTINLATTGAGGMDTGSPPASGFVALYAIYGTGVGSALLAVNASSSAVNNIYGGANMPSGYTASALLTVVPTNASSQIIVCNARDRSVVMGGANSINTATAQASLAAFTMAVPPNAKTASLNTNTTSTTNGAIAVWQIASTSAGNGLNISQIPTGTGFAASQSLINVPIIVARTLYCLYTISTGTPLFQLNCVGYSI